MGSCCSCPDKDTVPDNHRNKFKVINVDDDGNELGSGIMELTDTELILYTRKRDSVKWHYLCLRRYGYDSNLFSFESGRRCQTGQGIFAFKCARAEELFNMLQEIMQNNSINVVEEPVVERNNQQTTELEVPRTPRTPTTPGFAAQNLPNGFPRYPSFGDASSHPSSRHPSVGSARLPSVGEESTHPLLVSEEQVHTYINTTGVQEERKTRRRPRRAQRQQLRAEEDRLARLREPAAPAPGVGSAEAPPGRAGPRPAEDPRAQRLPPRPRPDAQLRQHRERHGAGRRPQGRAPEAAGLRAHGLQLRPPAPEPGIQAAQLRPGGPGRRQRLGQPADPQDAHHAPRAHPDAAHRAVRGHRHREDRRHVQPAESPAPGRRHLEEDAAQQY